MNLGAAAQLAAVSASRHKLAERLYTPWWYHPLLGSLFGSVLLVIGNVVGRGLFILPIAVLGIAGLGPLYRRMSGIDLYGPHAPDGGRAGRAILGALLAGLAVSGACSYALGRELGWGWAPWTLAGIVVVATTFAGRAYDEQLRAQVRASQP